MFKKNKNKSWWKNLKGKTIIFYPIHDFPGIDKADLIPMFPEVRKEYSHKTIEVLWLLEPTGKEHLFYDVIHKIPYSKDFVWKKSVKRKHPISSVR